MLGAEGRVPDRERQAEGLAAPVRIALVGGERIEELDPPVRRQVEQGEEGCWRGASATVSLSPSRMAARAAGDVEGHDAMAGDGLEQRRWRAIWRRCRQGPSGSTSSATMPATRFSTVPCGDVVDEIGLASSRRSRRRERWRRPAPPRKASESGVAAATAPAWPAPPGLASHAPASSNSGMAAAHRREGLRHLLAFGALLHRRAHEADELPLGHAAVAIGIGRALERAGKGVGERSALDAVDGDLGHQPPIRDAGQEGDVVLAAPTVSDTAGAGGANARARRGRSELGCRSR